MMPQAEETPRQTPTKSAGMTRINTSTRIYAKLSASSKTFQDFKQSEPLCAAYLGYTDRADFRRLQLSGPVIDAFVLFKFLPKNMNTSGAYRKIRDLLDDPVKYFGKSSKDLMDMYPFRDLPRNTPQEKDKFKRNTEYVLAGVIWRLTLLLSSHKHNSDGDLRIHQEPKRLDLFLQYVGFNPPDFDRNMILLPTLERESLDETDMEKFSRTFSLLKNLEAKIQTKTLSDKTKPDDFFKSWTIRADNEPHWMRPAANSQNLADIDTPTEKFPAAIFKLEHVRRPDTYFGQALEEHLNIHLRKNDLQLPPDSVTIMRDPRYYLVDGAWRDTIRRQLGFSKLSVDFQWLVLKPHDTGKSIVVYSRNDTCTPWRDVRGILKTEGVTEWTFRYALKHVIEDDSDYVYECGDEPLELPYAA